MTTPRDVRAAALAAHAAGLCVVPPRAGADPGRAKAPLGAWGRYQRHRPSDTEVQRWYSDGRLGVGLVCGDVSGGLEVIDIDDRDAYAALVASCRDLGLGGLVERIEAGYCEDSPRGVHWLYRCPTVGGNSVLARRADGRAKVETRGRGGYVIVAPTTGLHAGGAGYTLRSGGAATIASITPDERAQLHAVARLLDESPAPIEPDGPPRPPPRAADGTRPGDDFDARGTWDEALPGWTRVGTCQGLALWRRPGKAAGWSATTGRRPGGLDLAHIFSSSTTLEPGRNYTRFGAFARLAHGCDYRAAAQALRERGYGAARPPAPAVNGHYSRVDAAPREGEPDTETVPQPLRPSALYAAHPTLHEPIIDGLLRRREIMNLIAPPKARKSWLSLGLMLSAATGRDWLGRFPVRRGRVLLLDNELHAATLASRLRCVARAMALDLADYDARLAIVPLRGQLRGLLGLRPLFQGVAGQFDLVVMDAGYRFTVPGEAENDNAAMTARYNLLDEYADLTGAGVVYVHHLTKGSQDAKTVTDMGAGGGVQARAADAHVVLVPDETLGPDRLVVDAVVRSFAPIDPLVIRYEHPLWSCEDETAAPTKVRRQKVTLSSADFAMRFADERPRTKDDIRGKAESAGMSQRSARATLDAAIADGVLHAWATPKELHPRYATVPKPPNDDAEPPPF